MQLPDAGRIAVGILQHLIEEGNGDIRIARDQVGILPGTTTESLLLAPRRVAFLVILFIKLLFRGFLYVCPIVHLKKGHPLDEEYRLGDGVGHFTEAIGGNCT